MKVADFIFLAALAVIILPFVISPALYQLYHELTLEHGIVMSFFKFAVLASFGDLIGQRLRKGIYLPENFGLIPRAIVWGFIGISIKIAFTIFASGTPVILEYMGVHNASEAIGSNAFSLAKLLTAFSISVALNVMYAPVMMTFHKITDTHILQNGGTLRGFFRPLQVKSIITSMDWNVQWNFVFKRTIPLFWIPAQTINFMMPAHHRVLIAAFLGIALGVILAVASLKGQTQ